MARGKNMPNRRKADMKKTFTLTAETDKETAQRLNYIVRRALEKAAKDFEASDDDTPDEYADTPTNKAWQKNAKALREMMSCIPQR